MSFCNIQVLLGLEGCLYPPALGLPIWDQPCGALHQTCFPLLKSALCYNKAAKEVYPGEIPLRDRQVLSISAIMRMEGQRLQGFQPSSSPESAALEGGGSGVGARPQAGGGRVEFIRRALARHTLLICLNISSCLSVFQQISVSVCLSLLSISVLSFLCISPCPSLFLCISLFDFVSQPHPPFVCLSVTPPVYALMCG